MKERNNFLALMSGGAMGWSGAILVLMPEMWVSSMVLMGCAVALNWISTAEAKL